MSEQDLACGYCDGVSALQTSASEVRVTFHQESEEETVSLKLQIQISYLKLCKGYLFVMGNSRMTTHEIQKEISHLMSIGDFKVNTMLRQAFR